MVAADEENKTLRERAETAGITAAGTARRVERLRVQRMRVVVVVLIFRQKKKTRNSAKGLRQRGQRPLGQLEERRGSVYEG